MISLAVEDDIGGTAKTTVNGRGWDLLTIRNNSNPANSSFTTTAAPSNKFIIRLQAQNPMTNVNGLMDNFDPTHFQQWLLFSVDFTVSNPFRNGFDANAFQIDMSESANATNGGTFDLINGGNSIYLDFTLDSEPTTVLAIGVAGQPAVCKVRRRSQLTRGDAIGFLQMFRQTICRSVPRSWLLRERDGIILNSSGWSVWRPQIEPEFSHAQNQ